jgi:hypothetical protein
MSNERINLTFQILFKDLVISYINSEKSLSIFVDESFKIQIPTHYTLPPPLHIQIPLAELEEKDWKSIISKENLKLFKEQLSEITNEEENNWTIFFDIGYESAEDRNYFRPSFSARIQNQDNNTRRHLFNIVTNGSNACTRAPIYVSLTKLFLNWLVYHNYIKSVNKIEPIVIRQSGKIHCKLFQVCESEIWIRRMRIPKKILWDGYESPKFFTFKSKHGVITPNPDKYQSFKGTRNSENVLIIYTPHEKRMWHKVSKVKRVNSISRKPITIEQVANLIRDFNDNWEGWDTEKIVKI